MKGREHKHRRIDLPPDFANSEAFFRNLLESAPDAMIIVDEEGRITIVNEQAEEMFAYDREQMIGETIEFLLPARLRGNHVGHRNAYTNKPKLRPMGVSKLPWLRESETASTPYSVRAGTMGDR